MCKHMCDFDWETAFLSPAEWNFAIDADVSLRAHNLVFWRELADGNDLVVSLLVTDRQRVSQWGDAEIESIKSCVRYALDHAA